MVDRVLTDSERIVALTMIVQHFEKRIEALEKHSHEPFDFTHLIKRLEAVEASVKAIHDRLR